MSPWGRFILSHISIDHLGIFFGWDVLQEARSLWGESRIEQWCLAVVRSK